MSFKDNIRIGNVKVFKGPPAAGGSAGATPPTPSTPGPTSRNPVIAGLEAGLGAAAERAPAVTGAFGGFMIWDGLDMLRDAFVRTQQDDRPNLELKNILIGAGELTLGLMSIGAVLSGSPQHKMTGLTCAAGTAALGYALSNWRGAGVAPEI